MVNNFCNKAVFLDRDGVLIKADVIDSKPFAITSHKAMCFVDDVEKGLKILKNLNFLLIVVTNQPDVMTKKTSICEMNLIHNIIKSKLPIDDIFVCMEVENEYSTHYKPQPGMLKDASKKFKIDLTNSYIIGDRWRDVGAGHNAGCKTILIDYNYKEKKFIKPLYSVNNFLEAVKIIKDEFMINNK